MGSSDVLLMFFLTALPRKVYRDNQKVELSGLEGKSLIPDPFAQMTDREMAILRKAIDELMATEERAAADAAKADASPGPQPKGG
jgi:hypothetical protein